MPDPIAIFEGEIVQVKTTAYGDGEAVAKKAAISVKEMADAWRNIINSMKQLKKELSEDYLNEREE